MRVHDAAGIGVVSTHVPARGGHAELAMGFRVIPGFNTRARTRRALCERGKYNLIFTFQHTCPHEAGTQIQAQIIHPLRVSTHVPARGGH